MKTTLKPTPKPNSLTSQPMLQISCWGIYHQGFGKKFFENIRYYWTAQQITNITSLLKEYEDVFSKNYKYLKDLV